MMAVVRKYAKWLFAPTIPCAVGAGYVLANHGEQDRKTVAGMTAKMKTLCVGRFLINLPEEAQVELSEARIDGFRISAFDETPEEFQKRVAGREAQIRATPDRFGDNKNLESARDVKTDSGLVGKIFRHSRTVNEGTQGDGMGGVERYRDAGITTEALVHGHGISIDLFFANRGLEWIEDLPRLVKQLVTNPDNGIPAEPGFCMDRAYVRDPLTADQREQITMFSRLPSHPDEWGRRQRPRSTCRIQNDDRKRESSARLTLAVGWRRNRFVEQDLVQYSPSPGDVASGQRHATRLSSAGFECHQVDLGDGAEMTILELA